VIQKIANLLERQSQRTLVAFCLLATIVLGALDVYTGVEIHFLLLYLIPVFVASWFVSRKIGLYVAIIASIVWFGADSLSGRSYSSAWIAYWNLLMRSAVFVIFAITQAQLRARMIELAHLASRDFLTGLPNGHAFYDLVAKEMERAFGLQPMTLACIDVTGFKWVNHRFGYPAGDQMMCTIAHAIRQNVPRPDLVGRLGGTSFAVLLPNMASETAHEILQQLQGVLQEERRKYSHPLTFFISAVACNRAPKTVAQLIHEAEVQMTRIKGINKDSLQIASVDEVSVLN
jgi:diguanylate cyclase (GGDEF)-like protein